MNHDKLFHPLSSYKENVIHNIFISHVLVFFILFEAVPQTSSDFSLKNWLEFDGGVLCFYRKVKSRSKIQRFNRSSKLVWWEWHGGSRCKSNGWFNDPDCVVVVVERSTESCPCDPVPQISISLNKDEPDTALVHLMKTKGAEKIREALGSYVGFLKTGL